jgi:hypothetical protein
MNEKMKRKKEEEIIKKERRKKCIKERERKNKAPDSLDALQDSRGLKIKTHTHLSNHVQSDNEDFVCASG